MKGIKLQVNTKGCLHSCSASTPDWIASKSFCLELNQADADRLVLVQCRLGYENELLLLTLTCATGLHDTFLLRMNQKGLIQGMLVQCSVMLSTTGAQEPCEIRICRAISWGGGLRPLPSCFYCTRQENRITVAGCFKRAV